MKNNFFRIAFWLGLEGGRPDTLLSHVLQVAGHLPAPCERDVQKVIDCACATYKGRCLGSWVVNMDD